jgi:hypothetical protein
MIAARNFSTGMTAPALNRPAMHGQASTWSGTLPLAVWCRPSAFLILRESGNPGAASAPIRCNRPGAPPESRISRAVGAIMMQGCFVAARLVLMSARRLLRLGLVRPDAIATALRWSSGLTATGMRFWRHGRLRPRA